MCFPQRLPHQMSNWHRKYKKPTLTNYLGNCNDCIVILTLCKYICSNCNTQEKWSISLYCKFFNVIVYVFGLYDTKKRPGNKFSPPFGVGFSEAISHTLIKFLVSTLAVFVSLMSSSARTIFCPTVILIMSHSNFKLPFFTPWTFCFFGTT